MQGAWALVLQGRGAAVWCVLLPLSYCGTLTSGSKKCPETPGFGGVGGGFRNPRGPYPFFRYDIGPGGFRGVSGSKANPETLQIRGSKPNPEALQNQGLSGPRVSGCPKTLQNRGFVRTSGLGMPRNPSASCSGAVFGVFHHDAATAPKPTPNDATGALRVMRFIPSRGRHNESKDLQAQTPC